MKIKIVGFEVGVSRPTANHTVEIERMIGKDVNEPLFPRVLGMELWKVLEKSDFISIRRVND